MHKMTRILVALGAIWLVPQAEAQVAVNEVWRHPDTGVFYALPYGPDSAGREPSVHTSDDNGQTWTRLPGIPDGTSGELATRAFAVIPDAVGNDVLLAGTDADGLFRSIDGGATWTAWNDAAIGIEEISVAAQTGEAAWAVSSDGAVYVSLDDGATWTLVSGIAGRTVTAIVDSGGDMAWVGTDAGELIQLAAAGTDVTVLTGSSPFPGAIAALARTDDGTLYFGVEVGDIDGAHLYRTDSADFTSSVELTRDGESLHVRGLAATGDSVHVLDFVEDAIAVGIGEPLEYMVTTDRGATFTTERMVPVFVNQLFVGPCDGCDPWVLVAHPLGIYMKAREGIGWNALGAVEEPFTPEPPQRTNADLGVRVVTPTANTIDRGTEQYTLQVTNFGPDDVADVTVEIEFQTWADTGVLVIDPVSSWGESATIAGQDCQRAGDAYSTEHLLCRLDTLASGASASIVLIQNLPDNTIQLRIDADVTASNNSDDFQGNNWDYYEASVVTASGGSGSSGGSSGGSSAASSSGGGSGGGGSFGLLSLLGLLVGVGRKGRMIRN